jgi:hypothetical protein
MPSTTVPATCGSGVAVAVGVGVGVGVGVAVGVAGGVSEGLEVGDADNVRGLPSWPNGLSALQPASAASETPAPPRISTRLVVRRPM